jgi:peptidoglycan/LPS O-acetylase OafA/YrhL
MNYPVGNNNFDLIRLAAALQVAVLHVLYYLSPQWRDHILCQLLALFPGVPVFFFISGFLISRSYEKTESVRDYTRNRCLRIYPALHVCVALNLIMVYATGYFEKAQAGVVDILALYIAKTTVLQFYNPDFMRQFGDGVLNGSLWTICVELQFYFVTPILYVLLRRKALNSNLVLVIGIVLSIICNRLLYDTQAEFHDSNYWKLARVSFIPWIYMFLTGVLVQRNFALISRVFRPYLFFPVLLAYLAYAFTLYWHGFSFSNSISPALFFPLAATVLIAAYSGRELSRKLLRGHDISYGIYVYHIPFMNMFLYYQLTGWLGYTAAVIAITIVTAVASWFLVERPSLKRKHQATRPVSASSATP